MSTPAERMYKLFMGHTGAHGTYAREESTPGKAKSTIKKTARTERDPPTADLWELHLRGQRPLGIIPINTQSRCFWGVIDVDKYDLDLGGIVQRLEKMKIPMVVCRSKSGGAHIFMFFSEPVEAEIVIEKLREIAGVLGYGGSEIFPKQVAVLEDRGDLGNWLNMPYFESEQTKRYGVTPEGRGLSLEKFLDLAESRRLTRAEMVKVSPVVMSSSPEMSDAPPCLQFLCGAGIGEGTKNNTMFSLGVLARRMQPEGWEALMDRWNQQFMVPPPLTSEEMATIFRSLRKKSYFYRCNEQPLVSHCDKRACRQRKFGIGGSSAPDVSTISVLDTEPPLFFVSLTNGGTVQCTTDDLVSSRSFQKAALEQLKVMLPIYKAEEWQSRVQECLESAVMIEAPREVSVSGTMEALMHDFLADRFAARDRDELILGKPWLDEDSGQYVFRLSDLMGYLDTHKFREMTRTEVITRIRERGGMHGFYNIRGRGVNVWKVPRETVSRQTEEFRTPDVSGDEGKI